MVENIWNKLRSMEDATDIFNDQAFTVFSILYDK